MFHRLYQSNSSQLCPNLSDLLEEGNQVQAIAAKYIMPYRVLLSLSSMFISRLLGAWSDKFGRKLPLMISTVGSILAAPLSIGHSQWCLRYSLELVLAGVAIQGIAGKSSAITLASNS